MAILLAPNQPKKNVLPADGNVFQLEELQKLVGGYIECVYPNRKHYGKEVLIVNEEGRIIGLEFNREASDWAGQVIVGDAVLCTVVGKNFK